MRALIQTTFTTAALLGRGGVNAMTPQDVGPISAAIMHQYDYLGKLKGQIERGEVRATALPSRAALYLHAASQAFERGRAQAFGLDLPAYPGDGQSSCGSRCRCAWEIEETPQAFRATWSLGGNEDDQTCEECLDNAARWSPLVIAR
jgi:hypothetical protein